MVAHTRSGKGLDIKQAAEHRRALRAGPVNTQGLPALPTELLLEIISYLPIVPFPCYATRPLDRTYLLRAKLIRTLSQMCRSLRRVFLPLAYERIEVCASENVAPRLPGDPREKCHARNLRREKLEGETFATELIRQLEVVTIRDPSLARYVKILNIRLECFINKAVSEEIFRCLPLFPALRTVQFMGNIRSRFAPIGLAKAAENLPPLPSVTEVLYASYAGILLKCFPNAKHIIPRGLQTWGSDRFRDVYGEIAKHCPHAEDVHGLASSFQDCIQRNLSSMIDLFPELQVVRFGISPFGSADPEQIKQSRRIANLRNIIFQVYIEVDSSDFREYLKTSELPSLIGTAIGILKAKREVAGHVKSVSMLCDLGKTIFYTVVNKEGCAPQIDSLGLLPRLKELRADSE